MINDMNYQDEENDEVASSSGNKWKDLYNNNKKLVWILAAVIIIVIIASLASKGTGNSNENTNIEVAPVNEEESVQVNKKAKLKFKINKDIVYDGAPEKVEGKSENPEIADVDKNGYVTGKKIGKTKITGIYTPKSNSKGYNFSIDVIVFKGDEATALEEVSFGDGSLVINPMDDSFKLENHLIPSPSDAKIYSIQYISSDPNVAVINENGVVEAIEEGNTTITAIVNDDKETEIDVYVSEEVIKAEILKLPEKIEFEDGELLVIKTDGEIKDLNLVLTPSDANNKYINLRSSNPDVIKLLNNENKVSALEEGTSTITATAINGVEGKITVEGAAIVNDVTDIEVAPLTIGLEVGETHDLTPTVIPDNASNKSLSFESSNPSVVGVQPTSTMTSATLYAYKRGTAFITIKSTSNESIQKTITVNVSGDTGGSQGGGNSGSSNDSSITVRVNGDVPAKECTGQELTYYSSPKVTIQLGSGVSKIKYCYGTTICTPNIEFSRSGSSKAEFNITGRGIYILRVQKFDSSGNEIAHSNNSNYVEGALEYYINTKASGTKCTRNGGNDGTTTATTAGCYVGSTSQGVSNAFTWVTTGGTVGRNQSKTVITTRANCTKANGGVNVCFKSGSTYCYGSYCALRTGYTYLPDISTAANCGGIKPEATCPSISSTDVTCSSIGQCSSTVLKISGQAQGGTLKYRSKDTASGSYGNWTTIAPKRSSYGTTYVEVKVEGDSTHSDKNCGEYHITINQSATTSSRVAIVFNAGAGSINGNSRVTMYATNGTKLLYTTSTGTTTGSVPIPTRTGYIFNGWYTMSSNSSPNNEIVIDENGNIISGTGWTDSNGKWIITGPKTLYAHWTQQNKTITDIKPMSGEYGTVYNNAMTTPLDYGEKNYPDNNKKINHQVTYSDGSVVQRVTLDTIRSYISSVTSSDSSTVYVNSDYSINWLKAGTVTITITLNSANGNKQFQYKIKSSAIAKTITDIKPMSGEYGTVYNNAMTTPLDYGEKNYPDNNKKINHQVTYSDGSVVQRVTLDTIRSYISSVTSSDSSTVYVNSDYSINWLKAGTVTITITLNSANGNKQFQYKIKSSAVQSNQSISISDARIQIPGAWYVEEPLIGSVRYSIIQVDIANNQVYDIYLCVNEDSSRAKSPVAASSGWAGGSTSHAYMPTNQCGRWRNSHYLDIYVPTASTVCLSLGKDDQFSEDNCFDVVRQDGLGKISR